MRRPGPPGELWLAPAAPLARLLAGLVVTGMVLWELLTLAAIVAVLGAVLTGCTGAGSSCTDEDGCPSGWACIRNKCERPR